MNTWLPIITAPTGVMLWLSEPHDEGGFQFSGIKDRDGQWRNNLDLKIQEPTHWMPLPDNPEGYKLPLTTNGKSEMNTEQLFNKAADLLKLYLLELHGNKPVLVQRQLGKFISNGMLQPTTFLEIIKLSSNLCDDITKILTMLDTDLSIYEFTDVKNQIKETPEFVKIWQYKYSENSLVLLLPILQPYNCKFNFYGIRLNNIGVIRLVNCLLYDNFKSRIYESNGRKDNLFDPEEILYVQKLNVISDSDGELNTAVQILSKCIRNFYLSR